MKPSNKKNPTTVLQDFCEEAERKIISDVLPADYIVLPGAMLDGLREVLKQLATQSYSCGLESEHRELERIRKIKGLWCENHQMVDACRIVLLEARLHCVERELKKATKKSKD